jgi:acetoin utilization protein AcuB
MQVREVMQPIVMTIRASHSCYEAALRMQRSAIHHLPVVNERAEVEGILTDRDLRSLLFTVLAGGRADEIVDVDKALRGQRVGDVMSAPALTTGPGEPLVLAVRLMAERKIGSVPVVEDNQLVGIVTETDLLRLLFRRRLFSCPEVESLLLSAA